MFSDFLNNIVVGEGLLNLMVSLFILTFASALLLFLSRKWMSSTRSFLLLGVIFSYLIIIGLNLAFIHNPENRFSLVSFTFPAIETEQQKSIFSASYSPGYLPENMTLTDGGHGAISWGRFIVSITMIAGAVWLCGTVVLILKIAVDLVSVFRFQRKLSRVEDIQKQRILQKIKTRLGMKEAPKLYASTHIESPMTIGLFRPVIVIPEKLLKVISREECLCILSHESGHVKHYDNLAGFVQRIFIALNWWNPLAYFIRTTYSLAREDVCDHYAVDMVDDSVCYTTCLVNLAEKSCLISSFTPAMGLMGCERSLAKRLTRILSREKSVNTNLTLTKKLWLAGFCGALILCCAGIQTAFAQDDSNEDPRMVKYKAVEARLMEAVKAGEISKEDAEKRLVGARKAIFGDDDSKEDPRMVKYKAVEAELMEAVKAGKISKEDAERRLVGARKAIFSDKETREAPERKITREEYARAAEEMRKMVAEGRITKEDMEKRLKRMRLMIGSEPSEARKITREDYARAEAEMKKMVAEGKIKKEDMEKRLTEMREMIVRERGEARKVDLDAIKKRIEGAVEEGKMTREEADKMYEGIKKRMKMGEGGERIR